MNTQQIEARIRYWTNRRCPKQAAAWREILQQRRNGGRKLAIVTHVFPAHKG